MSSFVGIHSEIVYLKPIVGQKCVLRKVQGGFFLCVCVFIPLLQVLVTQ